jgi:hypothetical protein
VIARDRIDAIIARASRRASKVRPSHAGPSTALQRATKAAFSVLSDARDELDESEYPGFVWILHERVEREIVRLTLGEIRRLERGES